VLAGNRGLDVKRLVQLLAGDLDWLVMKALEKDRNRRYDTPGSFAEDIERYLHHEVILARPPSTAYKLKKFAQRNRATVITTTVVAASLVLGIVLASWQAVRALAAEGQATQAQAQAEIDRDRAKWEKQRAENALAEVQKEKQRAEKALAEAKSERSKAERSSIWAVQMDCLFSAMDMELKGSHQMAERLYLNGLDVLKIWPGAGYGDTQIVTLALCSFYGRRNTPEKGELLLRKLLDWYKQHPLQDAQGNDEVNGRILDALGLNLLQQHKWADAEAIFRACLPIRERQEKWLTQMGSTLSVGWNTRSMLGQSLIGQKNYEQAERYLTEGYKGGKDLVNAYERFGGDTGMVLPMLPVKETLERLVQLYEAWDKPDEAAKWRKELEAFKK
jgi:hypothetical protein